MFHVNLQGCTNIGLLVSFRLRRLFEILRFEAAAREALLTETLGDQTWLGGRVNSGILTKTIETSGETVDFMLDFMNFIYVEFEHFCISLHLY